MRSYPNYVPVSGATVAAIVTRVGRLQFDRMYGNPGWEKFVEQGAAEIVRHSAERYRSAISSP